MVFWKLHGSKPWLKKRDYICVGRNFENDKFEFDNLLLVVLGVTIDNKLTFDSHMKSGSKTWCNVTFVRITNYLQLSKKDLYLLDW